MGGSSVGGRLASACSGRGCAAPSRSPWATTSRRGSAARPSCSARATRARRRRRSPTYDAAEQAGAPRIVATTGGPLAERARADGVPVVPLPGGFQPRAAVGYSLVTALEAAALCGAAPSVRDEIAAASALARELAAEWGPQGDEDSEAKRLARSLHGSSRSSPAPA